MRILVIDDHRLFVSGLRFLLSELQAGVVVDEANRVDPLALQSGAPPDLVLLDLHLPGRSGLEALAAVRSVFEATTIVVLSSEEDPRLIRLCIEQGAAGFLPKASSPDVLIHALRLVLAGGVYLPDLVLKRLPADPAADGSRLAGRNLAESNAASRAGPQLSGRPLQALMLAVKGKSNKAIAREMGIAEGTVKLHLSAAFRLLGVSNRTEAVFAVAESGYVERSLR